MYQPITGETLTPAKAFSTLTLFALLGEPMMMIPQSLYMCTSCFISTKRLQKFFAATEVENEDSNSSSLLDSADDGTIGDQVVGPAHLQVIEIITRFYIALFTPKGCLKALPWSLGLKSFLTPSQLLGEYTACGQCMRYSAKPITRTISALTGTRLPLGGEKQL